MRRSYLYSLRVIIFALQNSRLIAGKIFLSLLTPGIFFCSSISWAQPPSLETLLQSSYLDDYYSNVVFGYRIISETEKYGARYRGNQLRCTNCHIDAGRKSDAIPLNIGGMYPKWRSKNGQRNGIGLRIRECFAYSLNGIMPPEDSPEVLAISAYISYLSYGQVIGKAPEGRGVPTLPDTGFDPNPANGKTIYLEHCATCHGSNGEGVATIPPLWGMQSYNHAAGMTDLVKAAGFIWANMPLGQERTLSHQQAKDVAAYINMQLRPGDPRNSKLLKLIEKVSGLF